MKLVLLDIDGTILLTQGAGRTTMTAALERVLGRTVSTEGISFSGRTDRQILRDILRASEIEPGTNGATLDLAIAAYEAELSQHMDPDRVQVLPGVRLLIEKLHEHEDVRLGLLTGNVEFTAYLKLAAVGLDDYFPFGAFGSDHEDRNCLPPIAMKRARDSSGFDFPPRDVFVVGDTPYDVTCGRVCGCRTVAVCTGRYTRAELQASEPDLLLDDFSDYRPLLEFIFGSSAAGAVA